MSVNAQPKSGMLVGGRYRLGRHLGDGRTGQVFQARGRETGDKVAIKMLHAPLCTVDREVARFAREFEATSQIDHPNTVRMLAFGEEEEGPLKGRHYLVMEYVEGKGLDKRLEKGPLELAPAVHIALQVARALKAAHDAGVVHRDVKPGNIHIVRRSGRDHVKVLDFGLARLQGGDEEDGTQLTGVGVRLGTVAYMSPEYITEMELDHRSDLYALGIVLFEMLCGRTPYLGRSMKIMQDHVDAPVPRASRDCPGLPGWLDDLIHDLMAKEPEDRPQSAGEVVQILEDHLDEIDTSWRIEKNALASGAMSQPGIQAAAPLSSVAAAGWTDQPVYARDPSEVPRTPVAVAVVLLGFGVFGVATLLGLAVMFAATLSG